MAESLSFQVPSHSDVLLALERTAMSREEYRGALLSPYPAGVEVASRVLTWREYALERQEHIDYIATEGIEPATLAHVRLTGALWAHAHSSGVALPPAVLDLLSEVGQWLELANGVAMEADESDESVDSDSIADTIAPAADDEIDAADSTDLD